MMTRNTIPAPMGAQSGLDHAEGEHRGLPFVVMGKAPAFQFYASDFLTGTMLMSNAEVGLYIRLLCLQAEHGSIPDDVDRIVQAFGDSARSLWAAVRAKFDDGPESGTLVNKRMVTVLAAREAYRLKQSEKGKASGRARLNRGSTTVEPIGDRVRVFTELEEKEPARTDAEFDAFWNAYPVKRSKGSALKAWAKIRKEERARCLPAIQAQVMASHFRGSDGMDYIPHPATWLNARRWEDEITEPKPLINPTKPMTKEEARAELARIRERLGIPPGGILLTEQIPEHVRQAMAKA